MFGTWWNLLSGYGGDFSTPSTIFGIVSMGLVAASILPAKQQTERLRALLVGLVIPVIMVFVISQRRPVFVDRYFIVFLPVMVYLIALGAKEVARRFVKLRQNVFSNRLMWVVTPLIFFSIGIWSGWQEHVEEKYSREDWRGLVAYFQEEGSADSEFWLSEPEASIPIQYYLRGDLSLASTSLEPLLCETACWWVLRQPYTATHAFSQAVSLPGRPSYPELPQECRLLDDWTSQTGIALWQVVCEGESG